MKRKRGRPRQPKADAVLVFKKTVRHWAAVLNVRPRQIRVQPMKRKWASCSAAGRVTFATALLLERQGFRRYVILHELLHLRVRNHGLLFKAYLSAYLPGWQSQARSRAARLRRACEAA